MQNNIHVTFAAILAIIGMLLLTQVHDISLDGDNLVGAAILSNRCDTTPETMVIVGSNDNHVYGLDAKTGCIVWRFDDADADIKTPVRVLNEMVFVGTTDQKLYALSVQDGTQQWALTLNGDMYGAVGIGNDTVYVADTSGNVAAYQISNISSTTSVTSTWTYGTHFSKQDVIVDETTVYVVEEYLHQGHIVVLDATTGAFKWKFTAEGMIDAAPALGHAVYVPTGENKLYRIHTDYGVAQTYFATEKSVKSTPAVEIFDDGSDLLYFGADDGYFYAVSVSSAGEMKEKWEYYTGVEIAAPAVVDETHVYFTTKSNNVYALDKESGAFVWSYATTKKNYAGPTLYDGILYVPSGDYSLHALDAATGTLLWTYETGGILYGEAAVTPFNALI